VTDSVSKKLSFQLIKSIDDVQNIGKHYYNTKYSESLKVSTLVDFQGNAKQKEK